MTANPNVLKYLRKSKDFGTVFIESCLQNISVAVNDLRSVFGEDDDYLAGIMDELEHLEQEYRDTLESRDS